MFCFFSFLAYLNFKPNGKIVMARDGIFSVSFPFNFFQYSIVFLNKNCLRRSCYSPYLYFYFSSLVHKKLLYRLEFGILNGEYRYILKRFFVVLKYQI